MTSKGKAGILWLARDLRLSDNPALRAAIDDGPLLAVFVIDGQVERQGAASRWRLQRGLCSLDAELRRRTRGSGLLVLRGEAEQVLPDLVRLTGAKSVHQSDWPAPGMRDAQDRVRNALTPLGARLILHPGFLLTHPGNVRTAQGGVYRVYTPFARALRAVGVDRPAAAAPEAIVAFSKPPSGLALAELQLAPDMHGGAEVLERFALPAGEAAAFARLDEFLDHATSYDADRDRPDLDATSGLSEHLALGEISPRTVWAMARDRMEREASKADGIGKFLSELIWREFAWHLFIDFPQMDRSPWRSEWSAFPWRRSNTSLERWTRAETGIALVDAGMREMRVTGRMHNRVRMVVASYLTKHLLTDWRLGMSHFAESLTDWDPASNAMNWQWVAGCGPDASPFFRIFNPEKQATQYDPQGSYRRRWLAGWMGKPTDEAMAYFDSLPSSWQVSRDWRERGGLDEARKQALAAFEEFKEGAPRR
ncbi:deoxyribodipyrimidine photo-lyase [Paracoccus sp. MBLB3053]|uniref:Deoxyribodipyrimidine photo-lyase n=1 Tax=Paracoccus aurantius TaxID=3073814 RepID=A0ABU2HVD7_9RHOB|nr:deoxyribodipyrimidine photo-lyase [Paracoccus sp. MBLB3053]MDS9469017.1 deoxyribodipyrimidine photo-lyase [Paracoccus sp. MBLB3053]